MANNNAIVSNIIKRTGIKSEIIVKEFLIGKEGKINAYLIYLQGEADKSLINKDILKPLMFNIEEKLDLEEELPEYLCKRYIPEANIIITSNLDEVSREIRNGKSVIIIEYINKFIILNTIGGDYRNISDPLNEASIKGSRESFVENLQVNVSIITRRIKDQSLMTENFNVGCRSKTKVSIVYIKDLVNEEALEIVKKRIGDINVDFINSNGELEQHLEDSTYSAVPQIFSTERPDVVVANLMEGKIAIVMNGVSQVLTVPALFVEFFEGVEDYNQRLWISNFTRILRFFAIIIIITFPSVYLTLIKFNVELIPIKFIIPISKSRVGIALPPFFEILSMEIIVELLREGGLRLPSKIAQTLSIVGGIIIGQTAVEAKIVSPPTLLIVGITVVATFLIPNYEMSLSIRLMRFGMLCLANFMGIFGISIGWFILIAHLYKLQSFSIPYFSLNKSDIKDLFLRFPMWDIEDRPKDVQKKDVQKQPTYIQKGRGKKNE